MTIDSRSESFLGIVEVHASQVVEAYYAVELLPCAGKSFVGGKVVACCIGVAGVYAYAYAALVFYAVYDGGQVCKVVAYVAALSGGVFYDGCYALCVVEGDVYALGYAGYAGVGVYGSQVASGVEVEHRQAQCLAALHLAYKRLSRFFKSFGFGVSEVDEVAVVGQYVLGGVAILLAGCLEGFDALGREGGGLPLALVLGEEGKCACSYGMCIDGGVFYATLCAYVCSYIFHIDLFFYWVICL